MKVTLQFSEQTSQSFDLCISADGIHSNIRQAIVPNSKPIYQGYAVFRGLVDDIDLKDNNVAKSFGLQKVEWALYHY